MRARLIFEAFRYIVNSFYVSGQRRRVTETIKRELRRRLAVEPLIGHAKGEHRMGRNWHRHIKFEWSMPNGGSWSKVMRKGLRLSRCSKRSTLRFVHDAFHLRTVDPGDDETGWRLDRGWRENVE